MKTLKFLMIFIFTAYSANVLAGYGSSSSGNSKKACKPPKLIQYTPVHLSVVPSNSDFSIEVSSLTNPKSIEVTIKKLPVEVAITESKKGYLITGKLPESIKDTFARVEVRATGTNRCKLSEGWLLNIKDEGAP